LLTGRSAGSPPGACRASASVSTNPQPLDLIGVLVVLNEPGTRLYRIVPTGETCLAVC